MKQPLVSLALALLALPASAQAPSPEPVSPARLEAALARYADETPLRELIAAAERQPGLDDAELRRFRRRTRRAAILPALVLRGRRGRAEDLDPDQSLSIDDDLSGDIELRWQLDRLVASSAELNILREERARARDREGRVRLVIVAYYERRRLQLERDLLGHHDLALALRILELAALLDALTGGAFSGEAPTG